MKNKESKKAAIFTSKVILLLGVVILVLFSISLTREIVRKIEINQEINALAGEVEMLEAKNAELADLIQYLNSTSWQEKEARSKLNLQKPGEGVIAILGGGQETVTVDKDGQVVQEQENLSNPFKWFKYFFE